MHYHLGRSGASCPPASPPHAQDCTSTVPANNTDTQNVAVVAVVANNFPKRTRVHHAQDRTNAVPAEERRTRAFTHTHTHTHTPSQQRRAGPTLSWILLRRYWRCRFHTHTHTISTAESRIHPIVDLAETVLVVSLSHTHTPSQQGRAGHALSWRASKPSQVHTRAHRHTDTDTDTDTETHIHRHTDIQTQTQAHRHRHRHTYPLP